MRTLLKQIQTDDGLLVGEYHLHAYSDGTITVRHCRSEVGPTEKPTLAGLKRILQWIDDHSERRATAQV